MGEAHNSSPKTPLSPVLTTAEAETGSPLILAAFLWIYFSLDESRAWSQTSDQGSVFVPSESKLFSSKIMEKYSFRDSERLTAGDAADPLRRESTLPHPSSALLSLKWQNSHLF